MFSFLFNTLELVSRSVHRLNYGEIPLLIARWEKNPVASYLLRSSFLKKEPLFKLFDKDFFYSHLLPDKISYRSDKTKFVDKAKLSAQLEVLIKEINQKKETFSHFSIIRDSNFNKKREAGLIILKFKDYPFVVKLFMETPKSFVRPYAKGFEPRFFFIMGSVNRHLMGFTRIKNVENIRNKIATSKQWSKKIETPRKWHWVPKNAQNIKLIGKNIGNTKQIETTIPGTYAIIADAIELKDKCFSIFNRKARKMCMKLCNYLDVAIDPHIDNFLQEKHTNKIVIVDTEHFPTLVGFKGKLKFKGYFSWYIRLSKKCVGDLFFRHKRKRHKKRIT